MNRTTLALSCLLASALALTVPAHGQPVAANSTAVWQSSAPMVSMFLKPDGSGTPLSSCFGGGGLVVPASVQVTLIDASGLPVAGYSERNIRLAYAGTNLGWCPDSFYPPPVHAPNCADGPTDPAGQTTFTMAYHGGGWHQAPMQIWVLEAGGNWAPIPNLLPINVNSPDYNGDLIINLSDIAIFAQDIGSFAYRSDFNWDGTINLSDIAMFAGVIGTSCP
ncbi:MAG: hypothetical protein R3D98_15440 [Candidatus Krumholzibacteriia bacterium]